MKKLKSYKNIDLNIKENKLCLEVFNLITVYLEIDGQNVNQVFNTYASNDHDKLENTDFK